VCPRLGRRCTQFRRRTARPIEKLGQWLARVPFRAMTPDGDKLALLRVEIDSIADVGAITPHLGGDTFRYDPLPAAMVSRRRRLRFIYFDGARLCPLSLAEIMALAPD